MTTTECSGTTTTLTRGSGWGQDYFGNVAEAAPEALRKATDFHKAVDEAFESVGIPCASWIPGCSEVYVCLNHQHAETEDFDFRCEALESPKALLEYTGLLSDEFAALETPYDRL